MANGNWYRDKLGKQAPQPRTAQPTGYPPTGVPPTIDPNSQRQQPVPYPAQQETPPQQPPPGGHITAHEAIVILATAAQNGQGEGTKTPGGITICPNCGDNMMSRSAMVNGRNTVLNTTTGTLATPAPQCAACGYNGMYLQGQPPAGT